MNPIQKIIEEQRKQSEIHNLTEAKINRKLANIEKNKSKEMREKVSNGNKGRPRTKKELEKLSLSIMKVTSTEEWKLKHKEGLIKRDKTEWRNKVGGWNKGIPRTEEDLIKMRKPRSEQGKANMRGPRVKKTCPHCGFVGAGGNMPRYHFDNCKFKK